MSKYISTILLLLMCTYASAQIQVEGTVKSQSGEPLPGVNIVVIGTNSGMFTDIDGSYSMLVSKDASLRFSMVGYEPIVSTVPSDGTLHVVLKEGVKLKQVVVTALGIVRDKDAIAYAHEEVESKPLTLAREINLGDALAGLAPGVNVSDIGTGPAGSSRIIIRGNHSISGNNQPLFVVDGIPIDNTTLGSSNQWGGYDWGDGLSSLNPDDIEKITILKGNAAAALYGSRASNGVILVTTKRGTKGDKIGVELNSNFTIDQALNTFDFQREYGQGFGGWAPGTQDDAHGSGHFSYGGKLDGSSVIQFDGVERPYEAVDNHSRNFYEDGHSFNNSIALTSGNEQFNWRLGFSDARVNYIVPNTNWKRKTFTLSTGGEIINNLTAEVTTRYILEDSENRPRLSDSPGNPNYSFALIPANVPLEAWAGPNGDGSTEDGLNEQRMASNKWITNPYWATSRFKANDDKNRVIGSVKLRYELDWVYLQGRIGTDHYDSRRFTLTPEGTAFNPGGSLIEENLVATETNMDFILGSTHDFSSGFGYDVFTGANYMDSRFESSGLGGFDFHVPGLLTVQNTIGQFNWDFLWRRRVNSLFGGANLHWKNWMYLNLTGRNDWFSTLPTDANNLFYPSVGASFVFSELVELPEFMSYGKLYTSWAKVSGDVNPYSLDLTYNLIGQGFQGQPLGEITNNTIPDRNLKPSTSREIELGLDLKFFGKRIGLAVAVYNRQTENDIIESAVSHTTGYDAALIKQGAMDNKGIEGAISVSPIQKKDWDWTFAFNASKNWNEVVDLGPGIESIQIAESRTSTAFIHHEVGQPASIIKGFAFKRDDAGNIVFGEDGLPMQGEYEILGNGVHDFIGGIHNSVRWKSLSLGFLIDFKTGGDIYSATNAFAYTYGKHKETLNGRENGLIGEGVTETGQTNTAKIEPGDVLSYYNHLRSNIAEEFVYDADFIKLRQVVISYDLPAAWFESSSIGGITVSAVGRNLALLYSKVPNVDPESTYNNENGQGLEMFGVPQTRSFGFNLNVKL